MYSGFLKGRKGACLLKEIYLNVGISYYRMDTSGMCEVLGPILEVAETSHEESKHYVGTFIRPFDGRKSSCKIIQNITEKKNICGGQMVYFVQVRSHDMRKLHLFRLILNISRHTHTHTQTQLQTQIHFLQGSKGTKR